MTQQAIEIEAIRKSVTVDASVERAFEIFTEGIATWWPLRTHSVGRERSETVVMEGRAGGRLYERLTDGEEALWGTILVWEPPHRLVFSWHPGRSEDTSQEVELRFTSEGAGARIELEHRGWERLGERAAEVRPQYDEGWNGVLGLYAQAART